MKRYGFINFMSDITNNQSIAYHNSNKKFQFKTRIVRGSDYSPASEFFFRVRKTTTGNNPKLDLVNVDAHEKIGQILSIRSQDIEWKRNSDVNQGP